MTPTSLKSCGTCGCVVSVLDMERHTRWHDSINVILRAAVKAQVGEDVLRKAGL